MNPDDFKEAWQAQPSQPRLAMDADQVLEEVRRKQRQFAATIFWRDFREVGTCLLMIPLWIYLGLKNSSPWTWYLMLPALLWVAGFMLADRLRHMRRSPEPGEPLRQSVEKAIAQVEHQIWLLRHVFWWYLLPLAVPMLAFVGQTARWERAGGWWEALAASIVIAVVLGVFGGVYWLNQYAVRAGLEPRRRELESLLRGLEAETPDAGRS